ncbi:MAG: PAS domain-containing protein [Thermodesulfobacteriota bacterium]
MADLQTAPVTSPDGDYFKALFDAVPSPVFIVDADVRILDYNEAAAGMLGPDRSSQLMKRGGEALHCLHADETPEGCGHAGDCKDCLVRNSVGAAIRDGRIVRAKTRMELRAGASDETVTLDLLVTAAPFTFNGMPLSLLILEDISELTRLREIIPICSYCKKIRNDAGYWQSVEDYISRNTGFDFSHAICGPCLEKHYGSVLKK